jgi:hypothetical protein
MSSRKPMTPWLPGPSGGKVGKRQDVCIETPQAPTKFKDTKPESKNPNTEQFAPTDGVPIRSRRRMGGYG